MSGQTHRNADAFFLQGSRDEGILLVHGYTGAPSEMRMLGNFLQEEGGYTVLGVCLAGHCTTAEALEQTTWPDWYEAVEEGVKELHRHCRHIYIAGQSMGGLLAMLALVRVPFDRWFRFAFPLVVKVTLFGCIIMTIAIKMGWN